MRFLRFLLLACAAFFISAATAQDLAPIPPLQARVTDTVGLLSPQQRASLEAKLQAHETKTGNQVAILLIKDTGPEAIEQYGIRVAEAWKIGRKDVDDGVILIVAKATRKMRIEVGRGAEGVIPDVYAKRIIQDVMAPHFRQGDFYGGLDAATSVIHSLLNKEPFPPPKATASAKKSSEGQIILSSFVFLVFLVLFLIRLAGRSRTTDYAGRRNHYYGGSYYDGGGSGGFGGGSFGGGGGDFGGGGASGDW